MRIYNGTKSNMDLPLANKSRLIIRPRSVSNEFLSTVEFLQMMVMSYSRDDIAFIPSGPSDTAMAAQVSTMPGYIANSVEEAVVRFTVIPRDNTNIPISTSSKTLSESKDNNHKQQKQQSVDKDNLPGKESK